MVVTNVRGGNYLATGKVSLKIICIILFLLGVFLFFIDYEAVGVVAAIIAFLLYPSSYKRGRRRSVSRSKSYAHASYIDLDESNNDLDWDFNNDSDDGSSNDSGTLDPNSSDGGDSGSSSN